MARTSQYTADERLARRRAAQRRYQANIRDLTREDRAHPRASARLIEESVRHITPPPEALAPLLPRPHLDAMLCITTIPDVPATAHWSPRAKQAFLLVWQVNAYTRNIYRSYNAWERLESMQALASYATFPTRDAARKFLAIRRLADVRDTPPAEIGIDAKVHWDVNCLAAFDHTKLHPFGGSTYGAP